MILVSLYAVCQADTWGHTWCETFSAVLLLLLLNWAAKSCSPFFWHTQNMGMSCNMLSICETEASTTAFHAVCQSIFGL